MTIYSMLERWAKRCQEAGLFDAFLNDSSNKTSTEANKAKSSVFRARAEKRQQVDMEIDTAIIDKQVANLLERAQATHRKAKEYYAAGMRGLADTEVALYNGLYKQAIQMRNKAQTLELAGTQAENNARIVEMMEKVYGHISTPTDMVERIKAAKDHLALLQMENSRIDAAIDDFCKSNDSALVGVDELTMEDLQAEVTNEIAAETNNSPLAEVMEKQVDQS